MALEVLLTGGWQLRRVAVQIRRTGDKSLARQMSAALAASTRPVQAAIDAEAQRVMPGEYRQLLSRSLRHRVSQRTGSIDAVVRLTTFADGTRERRDIRSLEAGRLRHPVFGRSRRIRRGPRAGTAQPNPWAVTTIRAGFHRRGTANAADAAERAMAGVLADLANTLAKG